MSFRRQQAIGAFVVDFCAPKLKLAIELDGGKHVEQAAYDSERTAFLQQEGYSVLRFWNGQVETDLDGVVAAVLQAMRPDDPLPSSPK